MIKIKSIQSCGCTSYRDVLKFSANKLQKSEERKHLWATLETNYGRRENSFLIRQELRLVLPYGLETFYVKSYKNFSIIRVIQKKNQSMRLGNEVGR